MYQQRLWNLAAQDEVNRMVHHQVVLKFQEKYLYGMTFMVGEFVLPAGVVGSNFMQVTTHS